MNKILFFFKRYTKAVAVSNVTQPNTLAIARRLLRHDPINRTKFEVSFKIKNNQITNHARFLNMDSDAYSCKNPLFFLERLELYRSIIGNRIKNPLFPDVIKALTYISKTPMDLYFGSDIKDEHFIFAFWLIFGGVKKTGQVTFWHYDFEEIVKNALKIIKFMPPAFLRRDILNLGFDTDNKNIFYKLYYLLRDKTEYLSHFANLMRRINKTLSGFKYFYFFSKMHNKEGRCCKEKLFIEFLQDLYPDSGNINELLTKVLEVSNNHFELQRLLKIIKLIDGRISLISFEIDGTITFYIRPD